jgi:RNA polymerase sigma factor (sigma-70 family)
VRKAQRILGRRADAEDVVHALFTDLWSKGEHRPSLGYLYRAVTHRCFNVLRDARARARLMEAHGEALLVPVRSTLEGHMIDRDLLVKLLDRLDDATVEVVVYRYLDDMTQEEVAEVADVSRKTVQKRLDRAREAVALVGGAP